MSVYIEVSGPDADKRIGKFLAFCTSEKGRTSLSCSGTAWECFEGRLRILTAAAALQPFLESDFGRLMGDVRVLVRVHGTKFPARLEGIAEVRGLPEECQTLLNTRTAGSTDCKFGWSLAPPCHCPVDICRIAILTCDSTAARHLGGKSQGSSPKYELPFQLTRSAMRGDRILVVGSPFGVSAPDFFSDMVVSGILARAELPAPAASETGRGSSLLLADLAALPGMEGCPVISAGRLVGMLTLPLSIAGHQIPVIISAASLVEAVSSWSAGRTAGHERVTRSRPRHAPDALQGICLSSARGEPSLQLYGPSIDQMRPLRDGRRAALQQALCGVVGVALPRDHWASGVLVSKGGVFVTNAHLFDHLSPAEAARARVRVVHHTGDLSGWHDARVLYIMTGALDLAVLQMLQPPNGLQPLQPSTTTPLSGEQCHVAGHALFNPGSGVPPMLTAGNVSKVLSIPDKEGHSRAAMLLTAAAVHVGASGGAVLSDTGQLLGIVTSNTKHASGVTIPKLNYSIAAEWLCDLWQHIQLNEVEALQLHLYDENRAQLLKLWSLQPFLEDSMLLSKL